MRRALWIALLASCGRAERPWEAPWPLEPEVPRVKPLADGRYPIDLLTAMRLAGANNLEIALLREKVQEAVAREELAWERLIPTVGPILAFRRHEGLTQGTDGAFVDVDKQQAFLGAGFRLRWEIGEALFQSFAASQRYDGSLEALRATEGVIVLQAGLAYYELLREQLRERVLEKSIEVSDRLATELQAAFEARRGFEGDVLRARVQSSSSRIAKERALESRRIAAIRLGSLLRLSPGVELVAIEEEPALLTLVPEAKEADLVGEAVAARPELREAAAELAAARHEETAATWAPLIPDIQVDAGVGSLGPVFSDLESSRDYTFTMGWRIGPGGILDFGRQRLAESRVRQAEIRLQLAKQRVADEVRAAWTQVTARRRMLDLAKQELEDATRALALNQERQAANIGIPLEVLQAEEALTRARLDFYTVAVEYNQAQLRLHLSLGRKP
jgi:outer membrane protein TolC